MREDEVIEAFFTKATINRIQFDNLDPGQNFALAELDTVTIHPEFEE